MTWLVAGALTVTALAVTGTYWLATRHKEKPAVLPQDVPFDIHQQLSGYTFTHSDGDRRVYTIHAARTVSFKQGGTTVLEDVLVELFGKTGKRRDLMRTQQCQYNSQNSDLFSSGPVHIELNAEAENSCAASSKGKPDSLLGYFQGLLSAREVAGNERRGRSCFLCRDGIRIIPGMVYATKDGSLDLDKDVAMELPPRARATPPAPPMELTASHLRYEKPGRQIVLWGPSRLRKATRTFLAGGGKVFLDEANRVTRVGMEGSVKASESSPGRQVELSADRAQGEFDPALRALRHLTAEGNVAGQSPVKGVRVTCGRNELN